jgi:hypothetical protein
MTDKFFDKPIHGTVSHYTDSPGEQHDPDVLLHYLDSLLELEEVAKVRWNQYTPYFNDGDACVFNVHSPEVLLAVEAEEANEDDEDWDYDEGRWRGPYDLFTYGWGESWQERNESGKYEVAGVDTTKVKKRLQELEDEMNYHEVILSDRFGDPAEVTYDGEKFVVEHYSHD